MTVGAVYEGVNECKAGDSSPDTGGVAAPSIKRCEATAAAQTGWSELTKCFGKRSLERVPFPTTPSAPSKEASRLLLDVASTPPVSGGEWRAAQFVHTFYDRAYRAIKEVSCPSSSPSILAALLLISSAMTRPRAAC